MTASIFTDISTIALILLFTCLPSKAQTRMMDTFTYLQVVMKSSEPILLPVADQPVISKSETGLIFSYDDKRYECDWDDINQIKFLKQSISIFHDVEIADSRSITFCRGSITLSGFNPADKCLILKPNGMTVKYFEIPDTGSIAIDTDQLASGIYIISIGNKSIKIIK